MTIRGSALDSLSRAELLLLARRGLWHASDIAFARWQAASDAQDAAFAGYLAACAEADAFINQACHLKTELQVTKYRLAELTAREKRERAWRAYKRASNRSDALWSECEGTKQP